MIVEKLHIQCFRSLRDVELDCDELVAILGRNGSGKSSLLKALDVFYNLSYQATPFDYFARDTNQEIKISVTYADLRQDEAQEFSSQLENDKMTVTKVINQGGARYYGASREIPQFNEIRKLGAVPKRQALNELIESGQIPNLGPRANSATAADELMARYEALHPDLTQLFQSEQQFIGPKNIGGGKLDKFTKFVLIPAVRDAASETERKGIIYQLIDVLVARSVSARADVRQLNSDFEQRVKEVYSRENLTELTALATSVTEILSFYAPGAELDLDFDDVVPPKITLPSALASLVEDNFKSPISYSGHGVQRALVLALLQKLSLTPIPQQAAQEVAQPGKDVFQEEPAEQAQSAERPPDLILAIEEPELYLHPSRARYLSGILNRLSKKPENLNEPRTQVIYATHSPYFIDLHWFDKIRLARKVVTEGVPTLQCKISSFKKSEAATQLGEISGRDSSAFNGDSFVAHAVPVIDSIVSEGFFADVVVVVEGLAEVGVFSALQTIMGKSWDAHGIAIVPASGKNNIDRPVVVFRGLSIPTYFLFDGDAAHKGAAREKTAEKNKVYQRLAGAQTLEDFPKTQALATWAVFHEDLETELKSALGDQAFTDIRKSIAEELGYDDPPRALKNPEGAAELIRRAYASGLRVPILEDVVNHISALR